MAPPLPRILTAVPQALHVRLEIAKAMQTLAAREHESQQRSIKAPQAGLDSDLIKECAREFRQEFLSLVRSYLSKRRSSAIKAAVDDPKHPGWPAHTPEGKGGEFRPKDAIVASAGEPEPQPGIGHNQGPPLDEPPKVPKSAPATSQARTAFLRAAARWLASAGVRTALRVGLRIGLEATVGGPVADFLLAMEAAHWLYQYLPLIRAYLQPPKTLEELQRDALNPQPGYDIHHIVEQTPARKDKFPESMIDGSDNQVLIPRLKHWEINSWLGKPNSDFKDANGNEISPRESMLGKSWDERYRFGLDVLKRFKVLKP